MKVYSDLLDFVKVRRDAGKVSDLDVAEASANPNEAQSNLRATQGMCGETRRSLEVLLGRYPAAQLKVTDTSGAATGPNRPALIIVGATAGHRLAERRVLEAFGLKEAARLALLPQLLLEPGRRQAK